MADNMRVDLFLDALKQLQMTRNKSVFACTIFQSDHGSQYSSNELRSIFRGESKGMNLITTKSQMISKNGLKI
jgi:transposase InsO family protein